MRQLRCWGAITRLWSQVATDHMSVPIRDFFWERVDTKFRVLSLWLIIVHGKRPQRRIFQKDYYSASCKQSAALLLQWREQFGSSFTKMCSYRIQRSNHLWNAVNSSRTPKSMMHPMLLSYGAIPSIDIGIGPSSRSAFYQTSVEQLNEMSWWSYRRAPRHRRCLDIGRSAKDMWRSFQRWRGLPSFRTSALRRHSSASSLEVCRIDREVDSICTEGHSAHAGLHCEKSERWKRLKDQARGIQRHYVNTRWSAALRWNMLVDICCFDEYEYPI